MEILMGNTLPETNCLHLKIDGCNTSFLLGWPIFRGELLGSGRVLYQIDPREAVPEVSKGKGYITRRKCAYMID